MHASQGKGEGGIDLFHIYVFSNSFGEDPYLFNYPSFVIHHPSFGLFQQNHTLGLSEFLCFQLIKINSGA
jgi:hypothetical protein